MPSHLNHVSRSAAISAIALIASSAYPLPPLDEVVMYEANMRAMSVAGDFAGVIDRLDEIESLGVNVIWLMPIHPIGNINRVPPLGSPYSVRDYLDVSTEYGTLDDLHTLVAQANERGMSVILDWVANHTAWDHPWITQNPDWYTQDANGNIIHPPGTNWLDVADLNYDNPEMRAAMIDQMKWWVENTQIEGFRMDAADFVPVEFWSQCIAQLRASTSRPLLMLAEGQRDDHHIAGFDLSFGWRFYTGLQQSFANGNTAMAVGWGHTDEMPRSPGGHSILRWTTNHDETAFHGPPPTVFHGLEASLATYASLIMFGETPLIYSGQEVGTTDSTLFFDLDPIDWTLNPGLPSWYSWIIGLRQTHESIRQGALVDLSDSDSIAVVRMIGEERVAAWINTRPYPVSAPVPSSWSTSWTDLETGVSTHLQSQRPIAANEIRIAKADAWPGLVVSGALQTEQGDPADWDPSQSSLIFDRDGPVYTVVASNLQSHLGYDIEILTDRGLPPTDTDDPRIASGLRAFGDSDGTITIQVDLSKINNKRSPVVWIDTDRAPLQVVGNFMDEAGGNADWNPADPMFAMTPLGQGRYIYEMVISAPSTYEFKASFGDGWTHQVGTDGLNDHAQTLVFTTSETNQLVRLFVDLREQQLESWVNPCSADINGDGALNFFDVSAFLDAYTNNSPIADFTGDGSFDFFDISAFLSSYTQGCPTPTG